MPTGKWADPDGKFLTGAVITVFPDGHGCVSLLGKQVPLKAKPLIRCKKNVFLSELTHPDHPDHPDQHRESKIQAKKMAFVIKGKKIDNEFVRVGDFLHGKFCAEDGGIQPFKLASLKELNANALAQVRRFAGGCTSSGWSPIAIYCYASGLFLGCWRRRVQTTVTGTRTQLTEATPLLVLFKRPGHTCWAVD